MENTLSINETQDYLAEIYYQDSCLEQKKGSDPKYLESWMHLKVEDSGISTRGRLWHLKTQHTLAKCVKCSC